MTSYPIPSEPPRYVAPPGKVRARRFRLYQVLGAVFVVVALLLSGWLGALLLRRHELERGAWLLNLLLFWLLLTYVTLPRLNELVTFLYVPDYFIGRTRTGDGVLGDPVNLALDGTASDIHAAMTGAGWTLADPITVRSTVRIVQSTLLRRPYPAAPVSDLLLFGRTQDFAYQQEVDGNATRRHHVRFWHVPQGWALPGGAKVQWLAAATYDRAVGLSLFTLQVTHKVDADTDIERDYVINTVRFADHACGVRVIEDYSLAYHARNGGGDRILTDGHLPILDVHGAASRRNAPVPVAASSGLDRELPPPALLFTGALTGALLVRALFDAVVTAVEWQTELGVAIALTALWVLTVARHRWAWLSQLALASLVALALLLGVTLSITTGEGALVLAGLSVLVVLAGSSESARKWVGRSGGSRR